jgi:hypothetical protein
MLLSSKDAVTHIFLKLTLRRHNVTQSHNATPYSLPFLINPPSSILHLYLPSFIFYLILFILHILQPLLVTATMPLPQCLLTQSSALLEPY